MNINKAIRKQEKSQKRFLLILGFIFFVLPIVLLLSMRIELFFLIYLFVIELLILTAFIIGVNSNYIKYSSDDYKIKMKFRRFSEDINVICEKVVLVHSEGSGPQMLVFMITNSKFRNKKIKAVDETFLRNRPYLAEKYYRIKKLNPESSYFYIIISKGGYHKYRLLDMIYKNCVRAQYTDEAIERIKEYRN